MKLALLSSIVLFLYPFASFAQNPHREQLVTQAKAIAKATAKKDYAYLANSSYPKILEQKGGTEKMISELKEKTKQLSKMGIDFIDMKIGEPDPLFKAGSELHCLVPETLRFQTPAGELKQNSWLLAISNNEGLTWYFIDVSLLNEKRVKELFPDFNPLLKIPVAKQPELSPVD